ncbi:TAXI family TRAP transporter solute-binding subunit [uncultured Rhodoblastus sp.]|uniref:TAXI family TRAP transporter solute-binding subunit n=1 Tax=uncultured Rhodoblastus sp. TaxID=543037 RepID=UPI0025D36B25|nr:TAXI family TRAP transporter solute-binding subunit [uncultured Rhodoblastus sp.]
MFKLPSLRTATLILAGFCLLAGAALGVGYFLSPHVTLRITSGVPDTIGQKFTGAFVGVMAKTYPRLRFETVQVADLAASAKAMEDGKADIAVVRTDVSPPSNGQTVAILRRDVVAFLVPAGSSIGDPSALAGKTVAIPTGPNQDFNARALDTILSYFNIPPEKVKKLFLPVAEIGPAIHHKHAAAALTIGPIGPGGPVNVVASISKATKGAPQLLAIDQADAIVKRFPGFESIDVPEGAFKGHPATPDDTVTCLAVTYRLVVPETMLNIVAGLIGKAVFDSKAKLMAATTVVTQIEAPDTDSSSPVLPVHSGVSSYLNDGDQSFLDSLQQYVYIVGIPLSLLGSLGAVLFGHRASKKMVSDQLQVYEILVIADAARNADAAELDRIEAELNKLVADCVSKIAGGSSDASQLPASTLAIDHARRAIDRRRREISGLARAPVMPTEENLAG